MNYLEMGAALQKYTENYEQGFTDMIPTFVRQAEQRIYNSVLFPALRRNVQGAFAQTNRYLACPADFLAVSDLSFTDNDGNTEFLIPKDVSFIRQAFPNPTTLGPPRYYAVYGPQSADETNLTLIVGPTPDESYAVELHYFYYPASMVDAGGSWLGNNFDSVILYGALVEAYIFMKGEQDVFLAYETKFKEALAMAKRLGEGLEKTDLYRAGGGAPGKV